MSTISVAVILRATDVNDTRDYYHCNDGPNFIPDYYGNHPQSLLCSFAVVALIATPDNFLMKVLLKKKKGKK
jgi:hypothetical protein